MKQPNRENSRGVKPTDADDDWLVAYENHVVLGGPAPGDFPEGLSDQDKQELSDARRAIDALHGVFSRDRAAAEPTTTEQPLHQLGDFQILHEIGRGGMGVVYEAQQLSVGRNVALKVLPFAAMLDKQQLNRFKIEARAAGTLDHPNIVSVFSVGTERGVHYYAMQLIDGQSLAELIADLRKQARVRSQGSGAREENAADQSEIIKQQSVRDDELTADYGHHSTSRIPQAAMETKRDVQAATSTMPKFDTQDYFRSVAELGIQAAQALDHAHQNSIVHRDVKPGNLLLDAERKLWVTDFGLARIEADAGMTMTGDIVGTLRYMSPEQALGQRAVVDQRADIYSLGATLYELLCLKPVFAGEDRQMLLDQIAREEPCPPCRIQKSIPRDLGTIVLMALQKNPAARYATAQEMADDLRRFLESKPIRVRRPSLADRLSKWERRHRVLVWAGVFVLMATTLVSLVSAWLISDAYRRERGQRLRAEAMQQQADLHAERAQQLVYAGDMRLAGLAWKNQDLRQVRELLDRHDPADAQPDRRGYEWHFLDQASRGSSQRLALTPGPLYQVAFSPDGRWIATAGEEGRVRWFEAQTGKFSDVLDPQQGEVNCVSFAPDGKLFATAGDDGTLKIWQVDQRRLLTTIQAYQDLAFQVCFAPDQTLLASCGKDPVIRLWDVSTGQPRGTLEGHSRSVQAVAISPDGSMLASASSDGSARIWNLETRTVRHVLLQGEFRVLSLAFAPNGKWLLTAGVDKTLHSWDVQTGKPLHLFPDFKHHDDLRSVAISSDSRWVATGDGAGSVRLWHLPENLQLANTRHQRRRISWQAMKVHTGRTYGLAFSPDVSRLVSVGQDGLLMRLRLAQPKSLFTALLQPDGILDLKPVAHRDMVVTAGVQGVHLISLSAGKILHEFAGPDPSWYWVAVSADARWLAANNEAGEITIWDLLSRTRVQQSKLEVDSPGELSFSPTGKVLATRIGRNLVFMDVETGRWHQPDFGKQTAWAEFSPDDIHLALARHETNDVEIWDWKQEVPTQTYPGHGTVIYKTRYGPRGRLLAAVDMSRRLIVWDLEQGIELFSTVTHDDRINRALFTPDTRSLVTYSNDGCIRLWHVATGTRLFDLLGLPHEDIMRAVFACDGKYLCYVGDQERLLRIAPGVAATGR